MEKNDFVLIHDGNTHISGKNYNFNSQARIDNYSWIFTDIQWQFMAKDIDEMTRKVLC